MPAPTSSTTGKRRYATAGAPKGPSMRSFRSSSARFCGRENTEETREESQHVTRETFRKPHSALKGAVSAQHRVLDFCR